MNTEKNTEVEIEKKAEVETEKKRKKKLTFTNSVILDDTEERKKIHSNEENFVLEKIGKMSCAKLSKKSNLKLFRRRQRCRGWKKGRRRTAFQ